MTIFITWVRNRIRRGFSPIVLVVGEQRIGKTCMALKLASMIDKNFSVEKQMFFDIISFARAVDKYKKRVLIVDEAGIELDTYRFSDIRQRCFSHIVQSQAYKQNTLFIVLPHSSDLAKCHRKYVKALLVVSGHGTYIFYRPFVPYWDMNEIEFKSRKIEYIYDVPLPPDYLYNAYKDKFEKQIKQDILEKEIDKLDRWLEKDKPKQKLNIPSIFS